MSKFKYANQVWHEEFGAGIILHQEDASENVYNAYFPDMNLQSFVSADSLELLSIWIPSSERMPELLPADADYCPSSKAIFFETYYGSIFHGSYIQREADADIETDEDIASENITYEYFFNTHDGDELFEEDSVTRWMYVPD